MPDLLRTRGLLREVWTAARLPVTQQGLLSTVHGPEVVLGMLVAVLHLDVVAPHNCFARQLHIPRVIALRVA